MLKHFAKLCFVGILITTIAACERRSCTNVVCSYNEQCNGGTCNCIDGYEGTDCQTESYLKYVGSYNVTENCYSSPSNFGSYSSYITQGGTLQQIYIGNMFNLGGQVTGVIHTDAANKGNYIEIPYQNIGATTLQGDGTFDPYNNRMTLNLSYTFNGAHTNAPILSTNSRNIFVRLPSVAIQFYL